MALLKNSALIVLGAIVAVALAIAVVYASAALLWVLHVKAAVSTSLKLEYYVVLVVFAPLFFLNQRLATRRKKPIAIMLLISMVMSGGMWLSFGLDISKEMLGL